MLIVYWRLVFYLLWKILMGHIFTWNNIHTYSLHFLFVFTVQNSSSHWQKQFKRWVWDYGNATIFKNIVFSLLQILKEFVWKIVITILVIRCLFDFNVKLKEYCQWRKKKSWNTKMRIPFWYRVPLNSILMLSSTHLFMMEHTHHLRHFLGIKQK